MNALELLKTDHENVKDLLSRLQDTDGEALDERRELFSLLKDELHIHEAIEEEIFYPALKRIEQAKEIVLDAYQEHQVVDYIIEDMTHTPMEDDAWMAQLRVAKEMIEHHIEEEEGEMFKRARKALESDHLEELGSQLQERKMQLQMSHH
jgi:hypothetical protein